MKKKTIKLFIEKMDKLEEKKEGILQGGFGSMKGGFNNSSFSSNDSCTNIHDCGSCDSTNVQTCTNSYICFF